MVLSHIGPAAAFLLLGAVLAHAEVHVEIARSESTVDFVFTKVPSPAENDAGTSARWSIVKGTRDRNSAELSVVHDGRIPKSHDQPAANFFFQAGTGGGRILVDLMKPISIERIGTYSWHRSDRAPQVYRIYGAHDSNKTVLPDIPETMGSESGGWTLIAAVDTRTDGPEPAGQHAVAITRASGTLGRYRYLLLDVDVTQTRDPFGNTFFSEIDIIDAEGPQLQFASVPESERILTTFQSEDERFHFVIDTTIVPELADWTDEKLIPTIQEWYPKIVELLPSRDFHAARSVRLRFRDDMQGTPAWAAGNEISLNARWFSREKDREALGAVVHELVHVVQKYPRSSRPPGWMVEGIPDYIRWFLYEPESKGAEMTSRILPSARYDASYRVSANFLNWVSETCRKDLVPRLNAAIRDGDYHEDLWEEWTGMSLPELGEKWKEFHQERLGAPDGM